MRRLETLGLLATLALVAILTGSLVLGLRSAPRTPKQHAPAGPQPVVPERPRVEVLNAAGSAGLARAATRVLRESGIDVVYFGNAESFGRDSSVVIQRAGSAADARRVAEALGIQQIRQQPDSSLYLEVTVVLGRDWSAPAPFPAAARSP